MDRLSGPKQRLPTDPLDRPTRRPSQSDPPTTEQRYRLATRAARVGVWDTDLESGRIYIDPGLKEMLGFEQDEPDNDLESWMKRVAPSDLPRVMTAAKEHINGETPRFAQEMRVRNKDGAMLWFALSGQLLEDPRGRRFVGTAIDITTRKRTETELRQSEQRYRAVLEKSQDGIFLICSQSRRILEANSALARMLGYSMDELQSMTLYDLSSHAPKNIDEVIAAIMEEGGRFLGARSLQHKNGSPIEVEVAVSVLDFDGRKVLSALARDTRERDRAERERRRFEATIQESQRLESLGVLAGGIAHDLNNMLAGVLGNASLALDQLADGTAPRRFVERIEDSARRAADLSRHLLAYAGEATLSIQPLDLSDLARGMVRLLEVSVSKKSAICLTVQDDLPAIEGDASEIGQVLMNLIINASEALADSPGAIGVSTGLARLDRVRLDQCFLGADLSPDEYVFLEVSDSGCGMQADQISRIFDPYFTTKSSLDSGRGLGLAAVLGIVRAHRGAVEVESTPDYGTVFRVFLPASAEPAVGISAAIEIPADMGRGNTVLLTDDEAAVREVARTMLERMGYDVLIAANGRDAVELFRDRCDDICLVLLDMSMPVLDGEEAYAEIMQIRDDVPVLFSSGYNEPEQISKRVGFLRKPYRMGNLVSAIQRLLATPDS